MNNYFAKLWSMFRGQVMKINRRWVIYFTAIALILISFWWEYSLIISYTPLEGQQSKVSYFSSIATSFALGFLLVMSIFQYGYIVYSQHKRSTSNSGGSHPHSIAAGNMVFGYVVATVIGFACLWLILKEDVLVERAVLDSSFIPPSVNNVFMMFFPYWKNFWIILLAILFLFLDFFVRDALKDKAGQLLFDISIIITLIVGSVFIGSLHDTINSSDMALGYNTGMLVFHIILAVLSFDP